MNYRHAFTLGAIALACALLVSSAHAQEPKIYLDVEDITAEPGQQIMVSVFIENLPDTISVYQLGLTLSRPDIGFFVPILDQTGTLTDGWSGSVQSFGDYSERVTSGAGLPPNWTPIPPNTSGTLFKVAIELYCEIPDTMPDRTLNIALNLVNTFFSTPDGTTIVPLDFTSGSVTAGLRCPYQGDIEPDGFITALDLAAMISVLFEGGPDPQDPCCPHTRFDLDCDGFATALDLSRLIDHLFAGGVGPCKL